MGGGRKGKRGESDKAICRKGKLKIFQIGDNEGRQLKVWEGKGCGSTYASMCSALTMCTLASWEHSIFREAHLIVDQLQHLEEHEGMASQDSHTGCQLHVLK